MFLMGPLEVTATTPDDEVRFAAASGDLTSPAEDGVVLDMPALTVYRVIGGVHELGSTVPLPSRRVHLCMDAGRGGDATELAMDETDEDGAFAFESTDEAWGRACGLCVAVDASETHRRGHSPLILTPANPHVTAQVAVPVLPLPRRIVVRWLDAVTGAPIAGGDARVYAAPTSASTPAPATAPAADADLDSDAAAAADVDFVEAAADPLSTGCGDVRGGGVRGDTSGGDVGGGGGVLIASAAKDAEVGGVALDGSPYEIRRSFDDMPPRVVVRITGPVLPPPSSSFSTPCSPVFSDPKGSSGSGSGGEGPNPGGGGEELGDGVGAVELGGVYTEVTEELHFSSESDHTKFITAHLLRMPPGEEDIVWVVVSVGGGGGGGGGEPRLLKDVRLMCPTGEEVSATKRTARYAEAGIVWPRSAAAVANGGDATEPAATWTLRAPLSGDKAQDAWYRLLVDCSGGDGKARAGDGGGGEGDDAVATSGAVAWIYRQDSTVASSKVRLSALNPNTLNSEP
jgi:hypothetical protein